MYFRSSADILFYSNQGICIFYMTYYSLVNILYISTFVDKEKLTYILQFIESRKLTKTDKKKCVLLNQSILIQTKSKNRKYDPYW